MSLKKDLDKFKLRKEQKEALDFIDKNSSSKFFLLDLPTGVGKSVLALNIAKWYRSKINKMARIDIITSNKLLQDQYSSSFSSINDLKGKENYECETYTCSCAQGQEFNRLNKTSCDSCPYSGARESFINGGISLTNFYLYTLYALYNPAVLESRKSNVLIVDECHEYDDVFSNFISIKVNENTIKKYSFSNESDILSRFKKIKTISDYISFLGYFDEECLLTIQDMEKVISNTERSSKSDIRDLKISKLLKEKNSDVAIMNMISDLSQYSIKINISIEEYKKNPENWVLETNYNEKTKNKEYSLEPIWAFDYLNKYVFSNYDMVFLMSGTILNKDLFCYLNGLDASKAAYHSIPSPFPVKNRPIYYMPLGKMSYKNKEETFKRYIPYINKILKKYSTSKGIIHTNSFELSNWIRDNIKDSRLIFHDSTNKDEMLRHHFESDKPTVLVSPSMSTGVSLDDDFSRFQIIAKVPYPSLNSQKNKVRMKNHSEWYQYKTISTMMQMTGRSVRSNEDFADTIILDGSFGDVLRYSSHFIPEWLQDSIKIINVK